MQHTMAVVPTYRRRDAPLAQARVIQPVEELGEHLQLRALTATIAGRGGGRDRRQKGCDRVQ